MLITIKNNNVSATIDTMGAQLISLKDNKILNIYGSEIQIYGRTVLLSFSYCRKLSE